MALVLANRVQETGTANTTVSFTLTGAVGGFQSFNAVGNTNTTYYAATDSSGNWEVGLGTYSTSGPTLTRTTVYASSNAGSAVTFVGACNIFVTYPSGSAVYEDASGNVSPLGTIASGTWNATTIGVAYGGTGVTTSSGASSVVLRDANQNIVFNNYIAGFTATAASAGTTVLTAASTRNQILTGSTTHTFQMPNATTLQLGQSFLFVNNSSGLLTITNNASATIDTIPSGAAVQLGATNIGTSAGTFGIYSFLPGSYDFNSTTATFNNATISSAVWNGTTIASGYGGTGLTTFTAANNALYSTSSSALAAGTLPVAAGGTGVTSSTGTGSVVLSTSPTLVTPALGTPSAVVLTNATSVPVNQATGTLAVANGGTGQTSYTDGQILIGNTTGNTLNKTTITAGTGISVTNAAGSITIASTVTSPIPSGAVMLFYQAAAPSGWTQVTTQNDKALRVVSGTGAGTGGSVGFTTAFASKTPAGTVSTSVALSTGASTGTTTAGGSIGGSTGGFTLGTNEIPSHTHTNTIGNGYYNSDLGSPTIATCTYNSRPNSGGPWAGNGTGGGASHSHSLSASFTGTGHNHTVTDATYTGSSSFTGTAINLAVNYIDVIICSKN